MLFSLLSLCLYNKSRCCILVFSLFFFFSFSSFFLASSCSECLEREPFFLRERNIISMTPTRNSPVPSATKQITKSHINFSLLQAQAQQPQQQQQQQQKRKNNKTSESKTYTSILEISLLLLLLLLQQQQQQELNYWLC